jgi:hypothetical protein
MTLKLKLAIAAGVLSALAFAQEPAQPMVFRQAVRIGDVGPQTFEYVASQSFSFDGNVVKNAPYSAEAVTETTQPLADGNRISRKTNATLYRDSEGRTRREESLGAIGPWASSGEPSQTVFINDPVSKTNLVLDTKNKTARKMPSPEQGFTKMKAELDANKAEAEAKMKDRGVMSVHVEGGTGGTIGWSGAGLDAAEVKLKAEIDARKLGVHGDSAQQESLGTQLIEGVQAEGTRTTHTIPAGAIGNDRPIQIVSERWYSPELQTVVMTKHSDPRMGETIYHLTNINRSEPSPSLFQAPADYTTAPENKFFVKTSKE